MIKEWNAGLFWLLAVAAAGAQTYTPGETYFGRSNYIEYVAGNLPVIFAAPHGGSLKPAELSDRTNGTLTTDTRTEELTRSILSVFTNRYHAFPHVVICRLHRLKIDCNREIVEGAGGDLLTEISWNDYQDFMDVAKQTVSNQFGRGLFIELHGHGHDLQRLELGYLLSSSQLNLSDGALNAGAYAQQTSIQHLDTISPESFAQLLRGANSLGGLLAARGYPSVPSPDLPNPVGNPYFTGGYNTERHGSLLGGVISAIQIECNFTNVRDSTFNCRVMATNLALALDPYFKIHFARDLADLPPAITALSNRVVDEDTSTGSVAFTISDDETPPGELVLAQSSSNPGLFPESRILLEGSGSNRTVTLTPATNQNGAATITLSVTDTNGGRASSAFQLTVNPVNDPPVLAAISNRLIGAGQTLRITNTVEDPDDLRFTFSLLSAPANAALNSSNGIFEWRPLVVQRNSNHWMILKVADSGAPVLSATQSFVIEVAPLQTPRIFLAGYATEGLQLAIHGDPGPDYNVLTTTNLTNWNLIFVTNPPALPFHWTDTNAGQFPERFYRILLNP